MVPTLPGTAALMLGEGTDEQIDFLTPVERFVRLEADVVISVIAETNTRSLSGDRSLPAVTLPDGPVGSDEGISRP